MFNEYFKVVEYYEKMFYVDFNFLCILYYEIVDVFYKLGEYSKVLDYYYCFSYL